MPLYCDAAIEKRPRLKAGATVGQNGSFRRDCGLRQQASDWANENQPDEDIGRNMCGIVLECRARLSLVLGGSSKYDLDTVPRRIT